MKTFIFMVAILCLLSGCAWAENVDIATIIKIESNGDPNASNKSSGAIGLMQITPIVFKEYQNWSKKTLPKDAYKGIVVWDKPSDLYYPDTNKRIGSWYINKRIPQMLKAYKIADTIDNRLWAYNAGIGNLKKGICPKETKRYIKKYHKLTKER